MKDPLDPLPGKDDDRAGVATQSDRPHRKQEEALRRPHEPVRVRGHAGAAGLK